MLLHPTLRCVWHIVHQEGLAYCNVRQVIDVLCKWVIGRTSRHTSRPNARARGLLRQPALPWHDNPSCVLPVGKSVLVVLLPWQRCVQGRKPLHTACPTTHTLNFKCHHAASPVKTRRQCTPVDTTLISQTQTHTPQIFFFFNIWQNKHTPRNQTAVDRKVAKVHVRHLLGKHSAQALALAGHGCQQGTHKHRLARFPSPSERSRVLHVNGKLNWAPAPPNTFSPSCEVPMQPCRQQTAHVPWALPSWFQKADSAMQTVCVPPKLATQGGMVTLVETRHQHTTARGPPVPNKQ